MRQDFDAYVTTAAFGRDGRAVFALGDGTVRFSAQPRTRRARA